MEMHNQSWGKKIVKLTGVHHKLRTPLVPWPHKSYYYMSLFFHWIITAFIPRTFQHVSHTTKGYSIIVSFPGKKKYLPSLQFRAPFGNCHLRSFHYLFDNLFFFFYFFSKNMYIFLGDYLSSLQKHYLFRKPHFSHHRLIFFPL
mgnify:CR=1 FL=1